MREFSLLGFAALAALFCQPALAGVRGMVYELLDPDAPREEWHRQPLPDAYVSIVWYITIPAPAHAITSCRYAEIARTDAKGEYVMDGPNLVTAGLARPVLSVYAPGRAPIAFPYPGSLATPKDITMVRSTLPPERRLTQLSILDGPGCPGFERKLHDPKGLLKSYQESLLEEAKTLKVDSDYGRNVMRALEASAKNPWPEIPAPATPIRVQVMPANSQIQAAPVPAQPSSR